MPLIYDTALDAALSDVKTNGTRLDICSQEPTTYAEATSTYTLGNKTGLTLTGPTNGDTSGRKVVVPAITDGSTTGNGNAVAWALTDGSSTLVATGTMTSLAVTSGGTFTLNAIDITIPDAVSE